MEYGIKQYVKHTVRRLKLVLLSFFYRALIRSGTLGFTSKSAVSISTQ